MSFFGAGFNLTPNFTVGQAVNSTPTSFQPMYSNHDYVRDNIMCMVTPLNRGGQEMMKSCVKGNMQELLSSPTIMNVQIHRK